MYIFIRNGKPVLHDEENIIKKGENKMSEMDEVVKELCDILKCNDVGCYKYPIGTTVDFLYKNFGILTGTVVGYGYIKGKRNYRIKLQLVKNEEPFYVTVEEEDIKERKEEDKKMNDVKEDPVKEDPVNHPSHYEGKTSIECIDSMVITFGVEYVFHFCLCNTYKYLWRHKNKNGLEDVKKAEYYLNKATNICTSYPEASIYGEDVDMLSRLENQLFDAFIFYGVDKRVKKD